jgi:hypothetical protein
MEREVVNQTGSRVEDELTVEVMHVVKNGSVYWTPSWYLIKTGIADSRFIENLRSSLLRGCTPGSFRIFKLCKVVLSDKI